MTPEQTIAAPAGPSFPQIQPSRRFLQYQRDKSLRGRSLCLANFLENLKKQSDYKEFLPELIEAISSIREKGRQTDDTKREKVLQILKEFPSTLEEIIEDSKLSRKEAEQILKALIREKLVIEKQQPHYLAAGEHFTAFYQIIDL
jgi:hypothetical protein